jgi:amidase
MNALSNPAAVLELDAVGQAELVRTGELSPAELVDLSIAQIEKHDPQVNAVIHQHFERARQEAGGALPEGPFRGVPILLKDLGAGHAEGDPIHWGTRFLKAANHRAASTSYLVAKLRAAGFVVVGRSNVPELGVWLTTEPAAYGPTRNPWNLAHSCGGSIGGAAAAVAARMVPVAHAGDGGGSIRNPASQTGLVGLKPSRGRVSLGPEWGEMWSGLISEFAITRSIRDVAALLDVLAGPMPGDPYTVQRPSRPYCMEAEAWPDPLRVGVLKHARDLSVHPECVAAVDKVAAKLEELGHHVEEAHPAALTDGSLDPLATPVILASTAFDVAQFERAIDRPLAAGDLDSDNWAALQMGRGVTGVQYAEALAGLHRYSRRVGAWFERFDVLLTPTLPEPPPPLGVLVPDPAKPLAGFLRSAQLTAFLIPFNATGQPALSLPLHWSADGLPIGVQLVAGMGCEDTLIRVGVQLEEALPWDGRRPPLVA